MSVISLVVAASAIGCSDGEDIAASHAPLVAVCSDTTSDVPAEGWLCPGELTVECDGGDHTANVDLIHYVSSDVACADIHVTVDDPGPFEAGTHTISVVVDGPDGGSTPLCSAVLNVVDTEPPVATPYEVSLWPPNHTIHTITPDDCVSVVDRCEGALAAQLTWATSDEPENDSGDGNTDGDIVFDAGNVGLRAERQGGGDGRVYRIGYHAEDSEGHAVDGSCTVIVPHDQSGKPATEGTAVVERMP